MGWVKIKLLMVKLFWYKLFGKNYTATVCGHTTKLFSLIEVFERKEFVEMGGGPPTYCHECLAEMAIPCAWCGEPILVGDPITLYRASKEKLFQFSDSVKVYSTRPFRLVGCLRWYCADTGADIAGFWIEPGKVKRIASPYEMLLESNKDVITYNDITDINDHGEI